jgi:tetratricopeptide (TPR) repeat protein
MQNRLLLGTAMLLVACAEAYAQRPLRPMKMIAKITTEDGTPLAVSPQIIFFPGECVITDTFGNGTVVFLPTRIAPDGESYMSSCRVTIHAVGYHTLNTLLSDGATIVLKRVGENEGSGISMTVLRAPANAKKEYERGEQAIAKKKWDQAQAHLEQAVALYPDYATAWSELSEALEQQGKIAEAQEALGRAMKADPKYLKPYAQLAGLAVEQQRWRDAADITERAMRLNPIEFPQVYVYHAQANLELGRVAEAEKSARKAIENDTQRTAPDAEYLLGEALGREGDLAGGLEHMKQYLSLAKKGKFADAARKRVAEWKKPK